MLYTKIELLILLETKILDYSKWRMKDEAFKHVEIGACIALLKANVPFRVLTEREFRAETGEKLESGWDENDFENYFWVYFPDIVDNDEGAKSAYLFSKKVRE